jgi:hypothetical protein
MSESSFPFQSQAVADAPSPEPDAAGTRTRLMILGAVAVALVLGLLAYVFLLAGGDEEAAAPATPQAQAPVAPAEPSTAPKPAKEKISAKSFGRDPFEPLIVEAADTAGSGSTGTATGGGSSTPATGGGSSTTNDTGTSDAAAPSPSSSHSFKVTDVAPDNSTVTVKLDGETYRNLRAGEVFAEVFKVRFIGGSVNSFQIGDEVFNVAGGKKVTIAG